MASPNAKSDAVPVTTAATAAPNEKAQLRADRNGAAAKPAIVIGKRFRKSFGSRFFWGNVIAHYVIADALFYKIRFDDGDVDVLPAPEVLEDVKMAEKHAREDKAAGSAPRKRQARELARTAATVATAPVAVQRESAERLVALAPADAQQADALHANVLAPPQAPASTKRKRTDVRELKATHSLPNGVNVTVYDQRLYLSIITTKRVTRVSEFVPRDDGSAGEIEATKRVAPGDVITHINGESVLGLDSTTVSREIRKATRPLVITFYRGELHWTPPVGRERETSSSVTNHSNSNSISSSSSVQSTPNRTDQGAVGAPSSHTPSPSAPASSPDPTQANVHPHQQQQHVPSSRSDHPSPASYSASHTQSHSSYTSQGLQQSSQPHPSSSASPYAPSMVPSTHPSLQVRIRVPPPPLSYQHQPPYQPYRSQYSAVSSTGVPMAMSQPVPHANTYTAAHPSSRASMQSYYQQQQQQQRVMEMRHAAMARQAAQLHIEQQWQSGPPVSQSMHSTSMMRADSAPLSYSNRPNYTTSAGYSHHPQQATQSAMQLQEVSTTDGRHLGSSDQQPLSGQRFSEDSNNDSTLGNDSAEQQQETQHSAQDGGTRGGGQSPLFDESPVAFELHDDGGETLSEDEDAAAAEKELAAVLGLEPATPAAAEPAAATAAAATTTTSAGKATAAANESSPEAAEEMSFLTPNKTSFVTAMPRARTSTTASSVPLLAVPPLPNLSQPRVMARTGHFNNVECAIVLIRRQRLLVSLTPLGSFVSLASFLSGPQGESGEIEESGKVCVGDVLVAINGMGLPPNSPVANVAKLLGSMARPFEIYFHRASWDVLEGRR